MTMIQIDPGEVSNTGTQFNTMRDQVQELVTRASGLMNTLESQFKGSRATRIFGEWHEMLPRLQSGVQSLEMAGTLLNRAAADFHEADMA